MQNATAATPVLCNIHHSNFTTAAPHHSNAFTATTPLRSKAATSLQQHLFFTVAITAASHHSNLTAAASVRYRGNSKTTNLPQQQEYMTAAAASRQYFNTSTPLQQQLHCSSKYSPAAVNYSKTPQQQQPDSRTPRQHNFNAAAAFLRQQRYHCCRKRTAPTSARGPYHSNLFAPATPLPQLRRYTNSIALTNRTALPRHVSVSFHVLHLSNFRTQQLQNSSNSIAHCCSSFNTAASSSPYSSKVATATSSYSNTRLHYSSKPHYITSSTTPAPTPPQQPHRNCNFTSASLQRLLHASSSRHRLVPPRLWLLLNIQRPCFPRIHRPLRCPNGTRATPLRGQQPRQGARRAELPAGPTYSCRPPTESPLTGGVGRLSKSSVFHHLRSAADQGGAHDCARVVAFYVTPGVSRGIAVAVARVVLSVVGVLDRLLQVLSMMGERRVRGGRARGGERGRRRRGEGRDQHSMRTARKN